MNLRSYRGTMIAVDGPRIFIGAGCGRFFVRFADGRTLGRVPYGRKFQPVSDLMQTDFWSNRAHVEELAKIHGGTLEEAERG